MGHSWRAFACAALLLGAVLLGCAAGGSSTPPGPRDGSQQASVPAPTEQTSEFGCVTPAHFCPNAFDIDLRQKACTCQGEPGRFKYRLRER
jgi:hypothetical protein